MPAADDVSDEAVIAHERVRAHIRDGIAGHNAGSTGSSTRISRVLLLAEPPNVDANEITDKGYINQRAVLERRQDRVEDLYAETPDAAVIVIDG